MPLLVRIIVVTAFVALAGLFALGFLASFEPGATVIWKLGYALAALVSLTLAARVGWKR